jgi:hypothetical protein
VVVELVVAVADAKRQNAAIEHPWYAAEQQMLIHAAAATADQSVVAVVLHRQAPHEVQSTDDLVALVAPVAAVATVPHVAVAAAAGTAAERPERENRKKKTMRVDHGDYWMMNESRCLADYCDAGGDSPCSRSTWRRKESGEKDIQRLSVTLINNDETTTNKRRSSCTLSQRTILSGRHLFEL